MAGDVLWLVLGLTLVGKGGDLFVESSVRIARAVRVPRILIGATLVSLATTMPELVVSATASTLGDSGIALGNAVGSCIANIGLIIGTVAVIGRVTVDRRDVRRRTWWMIGATLLVLAFSWNRHIGRMPAILLMAFSGAYLYRDYRTVRARPGPTADPAAPVVAPPLKSIALFVAGAVLIIFGSRLLVVSGIAIATTLGVPTVIIGLSVVAVGTSLPELATGIASARQGVPDLSIGNILGANLLNLALIIGLSGTIRPLSLSRFTQWYSYPWLVLFILAIGATLGRTGTLERRGGIGLLLLYGVYIAGLVL